MKSLLSVERRNGQSVLAAGNSKRLLEWKDGDRATCLIGAMLS
ncbi:hypothetical protein [Sphingobacterium suaedae]|uniref:Uncharacterized protein n=1 Tax=Sphingobacterium suaedae TaxID=1686402 RepID=A0ABW5KE38_9SPHI